MMAVWLVGAAGVARADVVPHVVSSDTMRVDVDESLYVLVDEGGGLTFAEVLARDADSDFEKVSVEIPNYGFSPAARWFHFALHNDSDAARAYILQIGYAPLDHVRVYVEEAGGTFARYITGDRLPFADRPIAHNEFLFPLELPATRVTRVYVRVETAGSMQVPLTIWTRDAFAEYDQRRQLALGGVYGLLLVMLVYNLFLFVTIRDRSYAYFCAFVLLYAVSQASLDGYAYQFLWPNSPAWNAIALSVIINTDAIVAMLFLREFLHSRTTLPKWDRVVVGLIGFGLLAAPVTLFLAYEISIRITAVYAMSGAALSLTVGILALRAGNRAARYFVVAWAVFLVGVVLLVLSKFGFLPRSTLTEQGPRVGSVMQVLALSLALADRINEIKAESAAAQRKALEIQTQATETLQLEVAKRTRELELQNAVLEENAEKLAALDEQKTHFFQNVSHELRTPLTLILTPLEQLGADTRFEDDARIELATKNARRLLRLVNQLLDFQKLAAGKHTIQAQPIDLTPFLAACGEHVVPTASRRDIEYVYKVNGERVDAGAVATPVVVTGEVDAIEKIVFNFLSNAVKYTPEGGRIELAIDADQPREGFARIAVTDTGPGIAPESQAELFEVFSQLDTDRAHLGTGLGLALARELTEALGGEVGVSSAVGEGSTFWAALPMTDQTETRNVRAPSSNLLPGWELDDTGVPLGVDSVEITDHGDYDGGILVIDDVPDMRTLIRTTLGAHGYDTFAASNGINGLRAARQWRPSLIITDWMMPGLTGPEVIAKLREDDDLAGTPVVLLTAKSDDESRLLGTKAGADAFLGKPFNDDELISMVRNLLQLKRRERQIQRLNDRLEASNASLLHAQHQRKRLASFIVHDLKNPLTVIGVNLEFIADEDGLSDMTTESVRQAMAATESMERMVLNLLDIHRSEDGALEANRDNVDLPALIGEVCRHMGGWAHDRGQRVDVDVDLERDHLRLDPDLVRRILSNLLDNSLKYAPAGGEVRVSARTIETGLVEIRVRDQGPGVPEEDRERIFDAYQQLERDRNKHKRTSRGLGLVFCRLAAEAHGGSVWVEDNDPKGSCFCVQLLAPAGTATQAEPPRRASTPSLG